MSALVLDAGALIALERDDVDTHHRLRLAQQTSVPVRTTGVVIAQVWRDPRGRQAKLAKLLRSVDVRPVDQSMGRAAGILLARTRTSDAVDATVVAVAAAGDRILTSDPDDINPLVAASGRSIRVIPC